MECRWNNEHQVVVRNREKFFNVVSGKDVKKATEHRKYEYRINRNVTGGMIQHFLYTIYLGGPNDWRAKTLMLLKLMSRYTEPYRPDRSRARERKIMRMNNRHIHEKNYRKAM